MSVSLDSSILIVCIPTLAKVFQADPSLIGWVNIAYLTMSQSLGLILARIGDAKGRKRVYMVGLAFYVAGITACALSQSPLQLILSRAVQGVGAATGWSLTMAIVVGVFPTEERGKALGTLASCYSVGLVAGPVLGGLILDLLGWRAVFWVRIPMALAALGMTGIIVREQKEGNGERFQLDLGGALSLFGCLSSLMLFLSFAGKWGLKGLLVPLFGTTAAALLVLFIIVERKVAQPILDLSLFRKRLFSAAVASGGLQTACTGVAIFLIPFYLAGALGYSGSVVGMFVAAIAIPLVFVAPVSGRLSDRIGSRFLAALGMAVLFTAFLALSRLGINPGLAMVTGAVLLLGTGMAIFQSPNNSAVMGSVPAGMLGTASAIVWTVRNIGSSSSVAMGSSLFGAYQASHLNRISTHAMDPAIAKRFAAAAGFHDTLVIAMFVAAAGFVASLVRGPK